MALADSYDPADFQALAIDVWDGNTALVDIFAANSEVTYPILMYGGQSGLLSNYNCSYDYFFIIGGDGIIRWRGSWNQAAMTTAIDNAVAELGATPVPDLGAGSHRLLANYPNPFNPLTRIPYELGGEGGVVAVRLEVLDVRGRLVRTLVAAHRAAGQRHEAVWDGTDDSGRHLPSGTYLARLSADGQVQSRFLTLVK